MNLEELAFKAVWILEALDIIKKDIIEIDVKLSPRAFHLSKHHLSKYKYDNIEKISGMFCTDNEIDDTFRFMGIKVNLIAVVF